MELHNQYFALRHGESIPNVLKIIISDPKNGCEAKYGLSEKGKEDVKQSALKWKAYLQKMNSKTPIYIYSSDFTRAFETANIFKQILLEETPIIEEIPLYSTSSLRERYFGELEGKSNQHYHDIWKEDEKSPNNHIFQVESTQDVYDRTTLLIREIESKHKDSIILLVSHGDTLQILQTFFAKVNSNQHRSLAHLNTAEVRELKASIVKT